MLRFACTTLVASLGLCAPPALAHAQAPEKKPGTVLTFYGLLKLEQDPSVPDAQKIKEWQAFVKRASEQTVYAKKAVDRLKNASKVRLVEAARRADADPALTAPQKLEQWAEVARLYPRSKEGRQAKRRVAHWRRMRTSKLVRAAEGVEEARRPKVERIQAWARVVDWVDKGSEAKAARRRIKQLQNQLFTEAKSVDRIARVDKRTKLDAWRDVLAGRPDKRQRAMAEMRVAALEAELGAPERARTGASN